MLNLPNKPTLRDVFLAEMDKVVPSSALCAVIEPFYPKARTEGGRRPVDLERMLRIPLLAAVVCVERLGRGRSPVCLGVDAPIRGHRRGPRAGAGRNDGV
ncbi:hypothetical protein FHW69_001478 [Luteibacter sp. Sphag1AF]|nr:hypothetical protein [Luteibacter sp. Sphag1AF]